MTTILVFCVAASGGGQNDQIVFRPTDTRWLSKRGKIKEKRREAPVRTLPPALGT